MENINLIKITLNFLAVVLLISLLATPFLFARNFAKVAGVKSESRFLVVSQVEKFPGMEFSQEANSYQISFTKQGSSQAFLGVLIINNPAEKTQTYSLEVTSGQVQVFFGVDLDNPITEIFLPSSASVPISIYSSQETLGESQTVGFTIQTN